MRLIELHYVTVYGRCSVFLRLRLISLATADSRSATDRTHRFLSSFMAFTEFDLPRVTPYKAPSDTWVLADMLYS